MPHLYVELAKKAIEIYIKRGEIISPFNDSLFLNLKNSEIKTCLSPTKNLVGGLPKDILTQRAGTFVSIMENGNLRGCIGTYLPTKSNIVEEIVHNAIAAATEDYRFRPIQKEDLSELSYTVYILSEPALISDLKELDPKKYGVLVKNVSFDGDFVPKSGLLLPDLKGIDTGEKQVLIACQKGGIDPEREKILIYKFAVEKYT